MPKKMSFAQFVRHKREERDDRQVDAAQAVGVVESTWRSYEQGKLPTLKTAYRVAEYLGLTLDELRPYIEASGV